jgi:hypothetical protein
VAPPMRRAVLSCIVAAMVGSCANATPAATPFKAVASTGVLMNAILEPAAEIIWASVGTVVTADGIEEIEPRTDDEWTAVRNAAMVVTESGNLLMMEGRARDTEDWTTFSEALVEIGARAVEAAEDQDTDAVFQVGGDIYNICAGCHQQYVESMQNARPQ